MAYSYLVANTGATTIPGLAVDDDHVAPADLTCPHHPRPGRDRHLHRHLDATQAAVDVGSVTNIGRATGPDPSRPVASATSTVTVTGPPAPSVSLTLTVAHGSSPP